jgi:hypothetical protein
MLEQFAMAQVTLRLTNERSAEGSLPSGTVRVQCECGRATCGETFEMPTAAYDDVRSHAARFVVMRDHAVPGVDRVVERRGRLDVVEAVGDAGALARELDPRTPAS